MCHLEFTTMREYSIGFCDGAEKRFHGGVISTGGLASEAVQVIWSHR